MGMDVYGTNPSAPEGEYFRRNVWGWHPLATLCEEMVPDIAEHCESWHSNDADGLDGALAEALAKRLEATFENGTLKEYLDTRNAALARLPNETCPQCHGTGIRTDAIGVSGGQPERIIDHPGHPRHGEKGWCNGCDGRGSNRPWATHYLVDARDVSEFVAFLKTCGGFEIH